MFSFLIGLNVCIYNSDTVHNRMMSTGFEYLNLSELPSGRISYADTGYIQKLVGTQRVNPEKAES